MHHYLMKCFSFYRWSKWLFRSLCTPIYINCTQYIPFFLYNSFSLVFIILHPNFEQLCCVVNCNLITKYALGNHNFLFIICCLTKLNENWSLPVDYIQTNGPKLEIMWLCNNVNVFKILFSLSFFFIDCHYCHQKQYTSFF